MKTVSENKEVYCNGAEQYKNDAWENLCNIKKERYKHSSICIEKSGLICKMNKNPYSLSGKPLPEEDKEEYLAIWVPKSISQDRNISNYFEYSDWLSREYKRMLIEKGITDASFFDGFHACFFGCEEYYNFDTLQNKNKDRTVER